LTALTVIDYSRQIMRTVVRVLLFFILFTSVSSAWEAYSCGYDPVSGSTRAVQGHDGGSPADRAQDLSGHCGHLANHFLGQVADKRPTLASVAGLLRDESARFAPQPRTFPLFRPPRHPLSV